MSTLPLSLDPLEQARARAMGIGVWLLIGVGSSLFMLFVIAYAMRMVAADWSPIGLPWQAWLATACLVAGSLVMQRAVHAVQAGHAQPAQAWLWAGGLAEMAFVGAQVWGWQSLIDARVLFAGNPAASFFYVLTALHGLHVLGGLVAWSAAVQMPGAPVAGPAWRIVLCARYWHFLLAVWLVLLGMLGWLTPAFVRAVCGLPAGGSS